MAKKKTMTNAMRILNAAGIKYETVEYEAETVGDHFGEEIAALTGIPPEKSFKTLVVRGDKTGIMVTCIPVSNELDLKLLAKVSGNKSAEMTHVKELLQLTGYIRGGVSPIGMKKKYPTYVNLSALNHETIAVSGGICGCTLILMPEYLKKATGCAFEEIITKLRHHPSQTTGSA